MSLIVTKEKSGAEHELKLLHCQRGMEIGVGGRGSWRLEGFPVMSTSVMKRDALVFGP